MPRRPNYHPPSNSRGVGLIEVLIAVLVMAIGMLGIASMQATALRNSQSSLERSQLVIHSYAILDAMRANMAATRAGAYNIPLTCKATGGGATLAEADIAQWLGDLEDSIGGTEGTACGQIQCAALANTPARNCTVTVQWDDTRGNDGDDEQQFVTVTRI